MANAPDQIVNGDLTGPVPLRRMIAITWLSSLGTGAVTNGLFFVTHEALRFSVVENLVLGLVMGVSYTLGAWGAAGFLRRARRLHRAGSPRSVLMVLSLAMTVLCGLPAVSAGAAWAFWVVAAVYLPMTGVLWPVVESYLSGGRTGADLRRATGGFNFAWSSAVLTAFWLMGPLLAYAPVLVVAGVGLVHLLCLPLIARLPAEPPVHRAEHARPHPEVYERLLPVFRVMLALSYLLMNAIEPILPTRLAGLGLRAGLMGPLVSTWTAARVGMFILCGRWHGWHGRWGTVVWTSGAMLTGFALVVTGGSLGVIVAGLALFGIGVGGVYAAAIYYAMAVGRAEVDAGGAHETVIGLGYTAGPLPALAAHGAARLGLISTDGAIATTTLVLVVVLAAGAVFWAVRSSKRAA